MSKMAIEFQLEESKSKIESLQQQIACLEDGLCESRLEASRVRTELVSEKSTSEVRLAEMQSKLNEVITLEGRLVFYAIKLWENAFIFTV